MATDAPADKEKVEAPPQQVESNRVADQAADRLRQDSALDKPAAATPGQDNQIGQNKNALGGQSGDKIEAGSNVNQVADAMQRGDLTDVQRGLAGLAEKTAGTGDGVRGYGDKLAESLKQSGVAVNVKDGDKLELAKDGKAVELQVSSYLDFAKGKVDTSISARSADGDPAKVLNAFSRPEGVADAPTYPGLSVKTAGDSGKSPGDGDSGKSGDAGRTTTTGAGSDIGLPPVAGSDSGLPPGADAGMSGSARGPESRPEMRKPPEANLAQPVEKDKDNRITKLSYPDGTAREFGYDESGKLNRIVQPDGSEQVLRGGNWQRPDNTLGSYTDKYPVVNNPSLDEKGNLSYERAESKVTLNTDGTSVTKRNGGTVVADSSGRPTEVTYPNGSVRRFTYDGDKVNSISTNDQGSVVVGDQIYDRNGNTGYKNPTVGPDGTYSVGAPNGDFISYRSDGTTGTFRPDGSYITTNQLGKVDYVSTKDGSKTFNYDQNGTLKDFVGNDKQKYELQTTTDASGKKVDEYKAADGTVRKDVEVKPDGTVSYTDKDGKLHTEFTNGRESVTSKSKEELDKLAKTLRDGDHFYSDGSEIKKGLESLNHADRVALDESYKKQFGESLTDSLKSSYSPLKSSANRDSLDALSESHLRMAIQGKLSGADIDRANTDLSAYRERAKESGTSKEQTTATQDKLTEELLKGGRSEALLRSVEANLGNSPDNVGDVARKYGLKYEEKVGADGAKTRQFFVDGKDGERLPVLDSASDNPKELDKQLEKWQDAKIKELESKYNLDIYRRGRTDKIDGADVTMRTPDAKELLALEQALEHSDPSFRTTDARPTAIQFPDKPTTGNLAYVRNRDDGQPRVLFEPTQPDFKEFRATALHEFGHLAHRNVEKRDSESFNQLKKELGYREVQLPSHVSEWQLKGADGYYYAQKDRKAYGPWTRVDDTGRPLKADGTPAGADGKDAYVLKNEQMRENTKPRPISQYFPNAFENTAEGLEHFRNDKATRAELYNNDPKHYAVIKEFDQRELDASPQYGKKPDGSSAFIRMPDSKIAPNNEENRKAVADYEKELATRREHAPHQTPSQGSPQSMGNDSKRMMDMPDNPIRPVPPQMDHSRDKTNGHGQTKGKGHDHSDKSKSGQGWSVEIKRGEIKSGHVKGGDVKGHGANGETKPGDVKPGAVKPGAVKPGAIVPPRGNGQRVAPRW